MTDVAEKTDQKESCSMDKAGKYLTFKLASEEYGLEIIKVQEIIGMIDVTRVPQTPKFIRGVINLRGQVIPVIDLRLKFGMKAIEDTALSCIIVVEVIQDSQKVTMGIIVDEVSEVMDIKGEEVSPPPEFGASLDTDFILGMGKAHEKLVVLLDVCKALSAEEVVLVDKVSRVD